jgi:hypothetical protein
MLFFNFSHHYYYIPCPHFVRRKQDIPCQSHWRSVFGARHQTLVKLILRFWKRNFVQMFCKTKIWWQNLVRYKVDKYSLDESLRVLYPIKPILRDIVEDFWVFVVSVFDILGRKDISLCIKMKNIRILQIIWSELFKRKYWHYFKQISHLDWFVFRRDKLLFYEFRHCAS